MTVIQNVKNYYDDENRNRPDNFGYDLAEEKKRIAEATEEIKKELLAKWQKRYAGAQIFPSSISGVNPNPIEFLLSFSNTLFYNDLAKKFGLSQIQRDALPQITWEIVLSKNWEGAGNLLTSKLNLNPEVASQVVQLANQNVLLKAKELSESKFVPSEKIISGKKTETQKAEISILKAIQQYPQLGEQLITSSPIKLKIFPQSVRPSIKNWIEDYRSTMGAQRHGMMERGNYLFHSENTKNLISGDRKKLAEILRSLDEDVALKVDPERQELVFEQANEIEKHKAQITEPKQSTNYNSQNINNFQNSNNKIQNSFHLEEPSQNIPNTNMRFSSPHTLPNEKSNLMNHKSRIMNQGNLQNMNSGNSTDGRPWTPQEERKEPTVRGNVVDLKG
jgi:hypothetical protein